MGKFKHQKPGSPAHQGIGDVLGNLKSGNTLAA